MLKKNFIFGLFFITNIICIYNQTIKLYSPIFYFLILILQVFEYKQQIKGCFKKIKFKYSFISVFKTLMLMLLLLIVLRILKFTSHQSTNILGIVFNNQNFFINFINYYFLKPTIVFLFAFNFKQNLNQFKYILIALCFSVLLNADIIVDFSFHKLNLIFNWTFIYYVLLSINLYFYNYVYVWIVFVVCNSTFLLI